MIVVARDWGFAAAFAKIIRVATAFLFPILLEAIGTRFLLYGLIVASVPGAAVTWGSSAPRSRESISLISEEVNRPKGAPKAIA